MKLILVAISCMLSCCLFGQKQGYKMHKVRPQQTFASIAAMYHISKERLASFNDLDLYEGEVMAQYLKIPVSPSKPVAPKPVDNSLIPEIERPVVLPLNQALIPDFARTKSGSKVYIPAKKVGVPKKLVSAEPQAAPVAAPVDSTPQ